jgi:hypothetical protein
MGLIQKIRLMLDKEALRAIKQEAAQASADVAKALTDELGAGKASEKAVLNYILKLRQAFTSQTQKLREDMAKGLIDQKTAEASAKQLADQFSDALKKGLANSMGKKFTGASKKKLLEMALPTAAEMSMGGSSSSLMQALVNKISGMFSGARMPGLQPVSPAKQRQLFAEAGGDLAKYAMLLKQVQLQQQQVAIAAQKMGSTVAAANKQATGQATFLNSMWARLTTRVLAAVSAYRLFHIVQGGLKAEADTQAMWARLAVTLADFGVQADTAWPKINRLIEEVSSMGYRVPVVAEVLANMIQITGDFDRALIATTPVLDLMRERHMTLETAARLVGRAMIGNVGHLGRYGIILDKTKDGLEQLIQRFGGGAGARSQTLQGSLDRVSTAWFNFQLAIGKGLDKANKSKGVTDSIITTLDTLSTELEENEDAWQGLAVIIKLIAHLLVGLGMVFGFTVKLIKNIGLDFAALFHLVKSGWSVLWRDMFDVALAGASKIGWVIDKISFGKTGVQKAIDQLRATNRSVRDRSVNEYGVEFDKWYNRNFGPKPPETDKDGNPLTRFGQESSPFGAAGKIIYREEEERRSHIAQLGRVALGKDQEASIEAVEKLNDLYKEQSERLSELDEKDGKRLFVQEHLAQIDRIRDRLDQRRRADEKKARQEAAVDQRIELLRKIALLDKSVEQAAALDELTNMEKQLREERAKMKPDTERYFKLTEQILTIEQAKLDVQDKAHKARDKEIEQLSQQVELDVERSKAVDRLKDIESELQTKLADETLTMAERLRLAQQLLQVQQAITIEDDKRGNEIARLTQMAKQAETRKEAERRLSAIKSQIQRQLDYALLTDERRLRLQQQMLEVNQALEGVINIAELTRTVSALDKLIMSGSKRAEALASIRDLTVQVRAALDSGELTEEEVTRLTALLDHLERLERKGSAPELNMFKSLKQTLRDDLPTIAQNAAKDISDAFINMFERVFAAGDTFGHRLSRAWGMIPKALAASITKAIQEIASSKVRENIAYAIEASARGFIALAHHDAAAASAAFKAAGLHTLAAAKWALLGGAAGAATGGLGYGESGGGSSGRNAETTKQVGPQISIYIDGMDPTNPRHQDLLNSTLKQVQERYGTVVEVIPNRGR